MNYLRFLYCFFLLTACSAQQKDLVHYIHRVKAVPAPAVKNHSSLGSVDVCLITHNIPKLGGLPLESMNSANKSGAVGSKRHCKQALVFLSKFQIPYQQGQESPFRPLHKSKPKQALAAFKLSDLKFVGMLQDDSNKWGLIEDPEGLVVRVGLGASIGKNSGRLRQIKDHWLEIEERIKVFQTWKTRRTRIYMDKAEHVT